MNEITPLLEDLAAQLGTTVEYLWPHMVLWARLEWLGGFIASVTLLVAGLYVTKTAIGRISAARVRHESRQNARLGCKFDAMDDAAGALVYTIVASVASSIGLLATTTHVSTIANFLVPEARVISILLGHIG